MLTEPGEKLSHPLGNACSNTRLADNAWTVALVNNAQIERVSLPRTLKRTVHSCINNSTSKCTWVQSTACNNEWRQRNFAECTNYSEACDNKALREQQRALHSVASTLGSGDMWGSPTALVGVIVCACMKNAYKLHVRETRCPSGKHGMWFRYYSIQCQKLRNNNY